MAEARRAEKGVGFLGRTRRAPSPPARGLMERCKLPQWGPGQSPGRNRFWCISKLVEGIKNSLYYKTRHRWFDSTCIYGASLCVSNFSLKFRGVFKHPKHPPSYGFDCRPIRLTTTRSGYDKNLLNEPRNSLSQQTFYCFGWQLV